MSTWKSTCEHCGKPFGGFRTSRRRFCDDKCRVSWHRAQKRSDPEQTLFVLVSVINQKIDARKKAIADRQARLADAVGISKEALYQLISEDEQIIKELESLLRIKENLQKANL